MSKASEDALGVLHAKVAEALTELLDAREEEVITAEDGELIPTGRTVPSVPPATLAVATKFLKDNNITCDISTNHGMQKLEELLARKQRRSSKHKEH